MAFGAGLRTGEEGGQVDAALDVTGRGAAWPQRLAARTADALLAQRGHLLPWAAVAFGAGIGLYFALPAEPVAGQWIMAAALALGLVALAIRAGPAWGPVFLALALAVAGAGVAGLRTWTVGAPVLGFRYYGPIEGRIVGIDRSQADALRLTLDRVTLGDLPTERTPARIRVALHAPQPWLAVEPGRVVMLTGHLSPPGAPAEPGDFDFRRAAWFEGLGAVGYTRSPVLTRAPPEGGLWLHRLRRHLAEWVLARIPGDAGGLAAAVTTGDRSGLGSRANEAMRDSGLYHVVSISGMHMGLLVGFVFGLVRTAVAVVPPLALRVNGKKVAALAALPAATFYLLLAGRDVATERAYVMVAVMLGAVLFDRQAVTLRSVAIAALVVLALRPETLLNPGFQMSFAAVAALAWVFGQRWATRLPRQLGWGAPVAVLMLSSLVAGGATAAFAAAHFNRYAAYGLLANLLASPAVGILVMPGAVLLALGAPLGLVQPALLMMDLGCRWVILVAERVAGIGGATGVVMAPPEGVLPLLTLGGCVLLLWRGRGRLVGLPVMAAAFWLWTTAERPPLLVAETGGVMGVLGPEGRALSRATGEGYAVSSWLENDGDGAMQAEAAGRPGAVTEGRISRASLGVGEVLLVRGERALAGVEGCGGALLLVTDVEDAGARPCAVLDARTLRRIGAAAVWPEGDGLRIVGARDVAGDRPWTRDGL
jgi:competence protein ComEC